MTNYKSQFTGEQIDEAIGKVLNAPNIYNYDGTVIIEKAESVRGLRRFKETVEPIVKLTYDEFVSLQTNGGADFYSNYGFEIEVVQDTSEPQYSYDGLSCIGMVEVGEEDEIFQMYFLVIKNGITNDTEKTFAYPVVDLDGFGNFEQLQQFNITNTNGLDEWLLANTEGVSV